MRREYVVTDPKQRYVAGERVPMDGKPLMLTDKQAAHDRQLGNIKLKSDADAEAAAAKAAAKADTEDQPAKRKA